MKQNLAFDRNTDFTAAANETFKADISQKLSEKDLSSFTDDQKTAFLTLLSGADVFLTGAAGTGKSFVLRKYLSLFEDHEVLVTASTGIAALNIGGATLHKVLQIPTGVLSKSIELGKNKAESDSIFFIGASKLSKAKVLVIDEISICRVDLFDYICRLLKYVRNKMGHDIQLVLSGDFYQLKPIVSFRDKSTFFQIFKDNPKGFAFLSAYWSLLKIRTVYLKQVIRQEDRLFSEALCKIRKGFMSGLEYINQNCSRTFDSKAVTLMGKNKSADAMNEKELAKIDSKEFRFSIEKAGDVSESDIRCPSTLTLKVGARVMFIANSAEGEYFNGDMGVVTALSPVKIAVLVDRTGRNIVVTRHTWAVYDYVLNEKSSRLVKDTVGTYNQYPLRLGWAITVHKSQGQTFDRVNLCPWEYWDEGQLYVALSRCRYINKVAVSDPIPASSIKTSSEVEYFYISQELSDEFDALGL